MPYRIWTTLPFMTALLLAASVPAADWPQWGGTNQRNLVSSETHLPESVSPGKLVDGQQRLDLSTALNVAWAVRLGSITFGNPVVARGRVIVGTSAPTIDPRFTGDRGAVICFDAVTGDLVWQLNAPNDPKANANLARSQKLGICSSATVDGDRVYVLGYRCDALCLNFNGLTNGNQGAFQDEAAYQGGSGKPPIATTSADADILWRFDVTGTLGIQPHDAMSSCPLVYGDLVYFGTDVAVNQKHKVCETPHAPSLVALNKDTGEPVAGDAEEIGTRVFHGQWSSPSLAEVNGKPLLFYGGGDGICYAFDPKPEPRPSEPMGVLRKVWSFDVNLGNKLPYKLKGGGGPSEIIGTPVCVDNRVYVAIGQDWTHHIDKGRLVCIDATGASDITQTGKIWSYDDISHTVGTVSVTGGLVYIADVAGKVHCIDAVTGKVCWVYDCKAPIWGGTLVADGKVYVGTSHGKLLILAAGREQRLISEASLGSPIAGTPVAANGTLYVATYKALYAFRNADRMP